MEREITNKAQMEATLFREIMEAYRYQINAGILPTHKEVYDWIMDKLAP